MREAVAYKILFGLKRIGSKKSVIAKVFVIEDPNDPTRILGYYTLTASSIPKSDLSKQQQKLVMPGLPVPLVLIGFMGRDDTAPKGIGAALIVDAARRAYRNLDIGSWGLILQAEANNRKLVDWYASVGFKELPAQDGKLGGVMFGPYKSFDASLQTFVVSQPAQAAAHDP